MVRNVRRMSELDADSALWTVQGMSGTAAAGQTTNIDWPLPEMRWINGGHLLCKSHVFGDTVTLQLVDKDNLLGYGAGAVLNTFVKDFRVADDKQAQALIECSYMALVPAGVYVRIAYTSTGGAAVSVAMNLLTHVPR